MSQTNLKTPLEYKYALLAGELKEREGEVARIQTLYEQLPALSARAQRIVHLLECAEELMKEIDPTWTPKRVKAVKPNGHKAPVAIGRISKTALDVLREAGRGLTISEIADQLLAKEGVGEIDDATRRRIRNSVDSTLRQKAAKGIVENDGAAFARRWKVVARH
jgi:hypothetical protein